MIIDRTWAMPSANTFSIRPIRDLIDAEKTTGVWIDPFANSNKIAEITNDINAGYGADYNMDAIDFLGIFKDETIDGVLFDPPYSPRQIAECYKSAGKLVNMETTQSSFWSKLKVEISRIVKPCGKVISCGWNSGGIGKKYGFRITRILLVPHGGAHNDTIVTVETKVEPKLPNRTL